MIQELIFSQLILLLVFDSILHQKKNLEFVIISSYFTPFIPNTPAEKVIKKHSNQSEQRLPLQGGFGEF